MDCEWNARDDIFERYVRNALEPAEQEAFQEHFFTCAACFDKVRTYHALRAELPAARIDAPAPPVRLAAWRWGVAPAAAILVLAVAVVFWSVRAPFRGTTPAAPAEESREAPGAPSAIAVPPAAVDLSALARFDPPVYIPLSLRGPGGAGEEKFQAAMQRYAGADYAGAISGLRAASTLEPDAPHYVFFLAICELLTGRVDSAAAGLRRTIALGDSPYLEEGHFYLAKACLQQGDIPAARSELQRTIERRGRLEAAARSLLVEVDALSDRRDGPRDR